VFQERGRGRETERDRETETERERERGREAGGEGEGERERERGRCSTHIPHAEGLVRDDGSHPRPELHLLPRRPRPLLRGVRGRALPPLGRVCPALVVLDEGLDGLDRVVGVDQLVVLG
jgi:hypothetical protein